MFLFLQASKMPGGFDFLLLLPDLNELLSLELFELLLLGDEEVVLVGSGLGGNSVEDRGHGLVVDDGLREVGGRANQLGLLVEGGLLGGGVQDGGDGLAVDHRGREGGGGGRPAERVVQARVGVDASRVNRDGLRGRDGDQGS